MSVWAVVVDPKSLNVNKDRVREKGYSTLGRLGRVIGEIEFRFRYSFTCQGTSTRRQRSDLFGLRVKLPLV